MDASALKVSELTIIDLSNGLDNGEGQESESRRTPLERLGSTWRWRIKRALIAILPLGMMLVSILRTILALQNPYGLRYQNFYGCDPEGHVWISGASSTKALSIWNLSYTLNVSLVVGVFKFSGAKTIDLCWDLFVGRGYQALSGIFVYNVFQMVMADSMMRNRSLMQEQVLAMEYSTVSISSLLTYIRSRRCHNETHTWRSRRSSRFTTWLLIISVIYVLAAPTWLSAMTSYQPEVHPYLVHHGEHILLNELEPCKVAIVDGARIHLGRLKNNTCVPSSGPLYDALQDYVNTTAVSKCYPRAELRHGLDSSNGEASESVARNPTFATREKCDSSSIFELDGKRIEIPSPVLDIKTGAYQYQHDNRNETLYGNGMDKSGICKPSKGYEWGYSFLLLFSFMVVTVPLALILLSVWYIYYNRVWPQQVEMVFGNFRTSLAVATSVREELGSNANEMSNSELEETLMLRGVGMRVSHVRSRIMAKARPNERPMIKINNEYPVGSERYKAYIREGFSSLS